MAENVVSHLEVFKRRLTGVSMPASGLPVAVNGVLTDLLQEQAVNSWKVVGDTTATVALLRLSPADPSAITTSQPGRSQVTFRKKPPSQVRRDRKRAGDQQKARPDQASVLDFFDCSMPLFMPTPLPNELTLTVGLLENNSMTVHTLSVRQMHVKPGETKQTVVFYNCLSLTLSSKPQHHHQLSKWDTSKKKTHTSTEKQKRKSVVRDTT